MLSPTVKMKSLIWSVYSVESHSEDEKLDLEYLQC